MLVAVMHALVLASSGGGSGSGSGSGSGAIITCNSSHEYEVAHAFDRWEPTLCIDTPQLVTMHTCGYSNTLSDTVLFAPCFNDDNPYGCIGLNRSSGTNPHYQSQCSTTLSAGCHNVSAGAFSTLTGNATLFVVCANALAAAPTAGVQTSAPAPSTNSSSSGGGSGSASSTTSSAVSSSSVLLTTLQSSTGPPAGPIDSTAAPGQSTGAPSAPGTSQSGSSATAGTSVAGTQAIVIMVLLLIVVVAIASFAWKCNLSRSDHAFMGRVNPQEQWVTHATSDGPAPTTQPPPPPDVVPVYGIGAAHHLQLSPLHGTWMGDSVTDESVAHVSGSGDISRCLSLASPTVYPMSATADHPLTIGE
eukprot:m.295391 g.295391  ORF g.295391 m.295391 type:complete len:360 (-) comp27176_c2_seq3:12-1091(-)